LVLCHREELISQAAKRLESFGIPAEIEMSDSRASLAAPAVVGSVQSLMGNARLSRWPRDHFDLVVADEAHPIFDPNLSLKGSTRGWGQYTKIFKPRHAVVTLKEPLLLPEGTSLRVILAHATDSAGGAYPLIAKRGRIALAGESEWCTPDPEIDALKMELSAARKALAAIPSTTTPVIRDLPPEHARETRVFVRGNWIDKGELIEKPGTPSVFPPLEEAGKPPRLAMAEWIASPRNPLTARLAVNRFWLELFGVGIVPTPEDFGSA
jgi:hypothetical protein